MVKVFYASPRSSLWEYAHGPADIPPDATGLEVHGPNDSDAFARWATAIGAAVMRGAEVRRYSAS